MDNEIVVFITIVSKCPTSLMKNLVPNLCLKTFLVNRVVYLDASSGNEFAKEAFTNKLGTMCDTRAI